MSRGKVRRRTWVHEGKKREAWGFTFTLAEGASGSPAPSRRPRRKRCCSHPVAGKT
jgi:hypothetical protein